ncbi:unnamed protein product [Rotaria socialis]|uniref:BK channel n=3 Tax=Rotaria socialis TaxID=392032 RepID=A0A820TAX5_9BILA|nr:unnamed protein product [Rotaria socialis]CAF4471976.1 unnamed protein product [Rotaria socialis]
MDENNSNASITSRGLADSCSGERYWFAFVLSSLATYFIGVIAILLWRCGALIYKRGPTMRHRSRRLVSLAEKQELSYGFDPINERNWATVVKEYAAKLISGQQLPGKILVIAVVVLSLASLVIYFYDVNTQPIELCQLWTQSLTQQLDLVFNIFFLFYFFLRFVAAQDKLRFWCLDVHSWVDYFTIPPSFTAIVLGRNWIGMRFFRIARIMNIPDILQFLHILRSSNSIRLTRMLCLLFTVWLSAAGFVHLVENSGDFFNNYSNSQSITYFQCVYFLIVTMSTVGYGDYHLRTTIGQCFIIFFITGGLALFARAIPELAEMLSNKKKYAGNYRLENGKKFVLVCGHITFISMENFLKDFLHEDRVSSDSFYDADVLIVDKKNTVDFEFQALLKRHFTRVKYFDATVMDPVDLERVKLKRSAAVLILANKDAIDPDGEDASNIMRVISIKNYHSDAKIIVQLLQYHNKMHLMNIPAWNSNTDEAVCIAELKLGLIAESCLNPGFSTMIANIFAMRSDTEGSPDRSTWLKEYLRGASLEMYTETLSNYFVHDLKNFSDAARFCLVELNILLFAIEVCEENGQRRLAINPDRTSQYYRIAKRTRGFFLAGSSEEASRARYYCRHCHHAQKPESIRKCIHYRMEDVSGGAGGGGSGSGAKPRREMSKPRSESNSLIESPPIPIAIKPFCFDTTGMFYWCPTLTFEQQTIDIRVKCELTHHVICCIFAEESSPVIGLRSFVMPLRASNFDENELKSIVFIGNGVFLRKEWRHICNFPKVHVVDGSPNDRATLRAINIHLCDMCVILSSSASHHDQRQDRYLTDKAAILCSLNIKAMSFDTECTSTDRRNGTSIPLMTELKNDTNVVFLDQDDDDDPNIDLYMTQPFACGTSFAISVLDSLMSATYFNENALTILRALITGGATPELEKILAEGAGMTQGSNSKEVLNNRRRPRVVLLPVENLIIEDTSNAKDNSSITVGTFWENNPTYGDLFVSLLTHRDWLCLGLYRLRDNGSTRPTSQSSKRVVVCSPPRTFSLLKSDLIYVIQQFQPKYDPPLNIEPEPIKLIDNNKQSNRIPASVSTVIPMPFTIVNKKTPIIDDIMIKDKDKI